MQLKRSEHKQGSRQLTAFPYSVHFLNSGSAILFLERYMYLVDYNVSLHHEMLTPVVLTWILSLCSSILSQ